MFVVAASAFGFQTPEVPQTPKISMRELSNAFEGVTTHVSRAVVKIEVSSYGVRNSGSSNVSLVTRQRGSGSGIVVDPTGFIITNSHVVEGALHVNVIFPRSALPAAGAKMPAAVEAKVIGVDHDSDLALLKVDRKALPFLHLADSDTVHQGQLV